MKHEKSPSSSPYAGLWKGKKSQQRLQFLDYSEKMLCHALIKHSLNSRDAKKTAMPISLTRFTHIADLLAQNTPEADHRGGYGSSETIDGSTLLKASKSLAEHVGRIRQVTLHIARNTMKDFLHQFT